MQKAFQDLQFILHCNVVVARGISGCGQQSRLESGTVHLDCVEMEKRPVKKGKQHLSFTLKINLFVAGIAVTNVTCQSACLVLTKKLHFSLGKLLPYNF